MPRTVEQILMDQNIDMAALVKAAWLNCRLPGHNFEYGATTIAQALTDDSAEIESLHIAIMDAGEVNEEDC